MPIRIIADSCCDLTPALKEQLQPMLAPLIVTIPGIGEYVDDGTADIQALIADLARSEQGGKSTCPSPEKYAEYMRQCDASFVITLSSRLSGSYNAACVGRDMVLEETPDKQIHIFDSLSAASGETQIALFLHERIAEGLSFDAIVPMAEAFIKRMRTFFVLEDLGNLFKNGRLIKVAGRIASMLKLSPVMGEDGEGNIKLISPSLGIERSLRKLVEAVASRTEAAAANSIRLVLAYCNCLPRAEKIKQKLRQKCPALKEIILVPTGALSTLYANNGGVIIAFQP